MFQTLKEMFRDQPHLASITLLVCVFSVSGLVYLLIDYIVRRRRKADEAEPEIEHTFAVPQPAAPVIERQRRIPEAGKPRYVHLSRKSSFARAEQKTEPERIYHYVTRDPGTPKEPEQVEHKNLLKDAVKLAVNVEVAPKKRSAE